jgi:drug/metabolite transporter (DMT)-like permease
VRSRGWTRTLLAISAPYSASCTGSQRREQASHSEPVDTTISLRLHVTADLSRATALRTALAATVASMCFGASVVATRFVVGQTEPVTLAFLRYGLATLCLSPVLYATWKARMPRRDLLAIGGLGVLFFGLFPWSFSAALVHLPSSRVATIIATTPLVTLVISHVRGVERITVTMALGQLVALAGLYFALDIASTSPTAGQGSATLGGSTWLGVALTFFAVLCGALYNVLSRPYLKRYPPLHVSAISMAAGTMALTLPAGMRGVFSHAPHFTYAGWGAVLFLGTFGGALGFALWIWALQRSTPSRVAVFLALNPVTATLLGVLLLGEFVTWRFVLGLACVIAGISLANRRPAPGKMV